MRNDSLFINETVYSRERMKQEKAIKRSSVGNARQRKSLRRRRTSGNSFQHGLEERCSMQDLNEDIPISEQAEQDVQNVRVSFRVREYRK